MPRSPPTAGALGANSEPRSPTNCRSTSATAASCGRARALALDEARGLRDESRRVIAEMEARYARRRASASSRSSTTISSAISSRRRRPLGEALLKPPLNATFIHRQTMAGAMRFTTRGADRPRSAHRLGRRTRAGARTRRVRGAALAPVSRKPTCCAASASALAELDVAAALAELAVKRDWTRPHVDASLGFPHRGRPASRRRGSAGERRRALRRQRLRASAAIRTRAGASPSSPARTWRANRPSCARTR